MTKTPEHKLAWELLLEGRCPKCAHHLVATDVAYICESASDPDLYDCGFTISVERHRALVDKLSRKSGPFTPDELKKLLS